MEKPSHIKLGEKGEKLAAEFLQEKGYRLITRNYRSGSYEIDIIAINNNILVILEVKSFQSEPLGAAEFRVHKNKQKQIIRGTLLFLEDMPQYQDMDIRFDVIIVDFTEWPAEITHHQAAFYADDYWESNSYY